MDKQGTSGQSSVYTLYGFNTSVMCLAFQLRPSYFQVTKSAFEALEPTLPVVTPETIVAGEGGRVESGEGAREEYALSWSPFCQSEALPLCPDVGADLCRQLCRPCSWPACELSNPIEGRAVSLDCGCRKEVASKLSSRTNAVPCDGFGIVGFSVPLSVFKFVLLSESSRAFDTESCEPIALGLASGAIRQS
jgi:hypothetical protein